MSSTIITVPKDSTFKLPEGHFLAIIRQYKTKDVDAARGKSQTATILFEVHVPGMENYECLARKIMPVDLRAGSVMRRFLEDLLGSDYFKGKANQPIDLQKVVVGQLCEIDLVHAKHDSDKYDWPLVDIESIRPHETVKEVEPAK